MRPGLKNIFRKFWTVKGWMIRGNFAFVGDINIGVRKTKKGHKQVLVFMNNRKELLNKIKCSGFPAKEVVLTLDEFFVGNRDMGSIGVNLYPIQPPPQTFYKTFKQLLQDGKIEYAFVRIADIEEVEWFFTDAIFVIGNISFEELQQEVANIEPSEISPGWMYGLPANLPNDFTGKQVYSLWWD